MLNEVVPIMDKETRLIDRIYSAPENFLSRVSQELKRAQRYLSFVSYLNIDTKHLGVNEDSSNGGISLEVYDKIRQHIRNSIRQTDIVSGFQDGRVSVLLVETNKPGAEIVRNRLQQSIKYYLHEIVESPMNWKVNIKTGSFPDDEHTPNSFYQKINSTLSEE